jgi:hypothetical protein
VRQLRDQSGGGRWDFSAGLLPHGINPTDIDLAYERRGYFLFLEGKRPGETIPTGQRLFLDALSKLPRVTVVHFEGDPPAEVQRHAMWGSPLAPSTTDGLCSLITEWYGWVESEAA